MPDATHPFSVCRSGQQRGLRARLVELIGAEDVAAPYFTPMFMSMGVK